MTCYHPLMAWYPRLSADNARPTFCYDKSKWYCDFGLPKTAPVARTGDFKVPCGQCIGCRLEYSRQWAIRAMHEASLYTNNCFITLTYAPEHLPHDGKLRKKHLQDFWKRLRKKHGTGMRYYACGEYGDQYGRPHYHACLFNFDFNDKTFYTTRNGFPVWQSQDLAELWGKGRVEIGSLTFESAAYIARYVLKKVKGKAAKEHYRTIHPVTGEVTFSTPEYAVMSRRPGIGNGWIEKYFQEIIDHDFVLIRGNITSQPPRFYDKFLEKNYPDQLQRLKKARKYKALQNAFDTTPERLYVKEQVKLAKVAQLPRSLD